MAKADTRITFYYPGEGRLSFDTTQAEAKRIKTQYANLLKRKEEDGVVTPCVAETDEFIVDLMEVLAINVFAIPDGAFTMNHLRVRENQMNLEMGEAQLAHYKSHNNESWKEGDE
jgi:hypothetical protein